MITVSIPETIYAFYALNRLGIVPNMIDPRTSMEGIKSYIEECDVKVVITLDLACEKVEQAVVGTKVEKVIIVSPTNSLPILKKAFLVSANKLKGIKTQMPSDCYEWEAFINNGANVEHIEVCHENHECCVIVHTGGTTGEPKSVMLSNENVNALVAQSILTGIDMKREHTWLDIMPPFIAYGIGMGMHLPLVIGMETILIPSFEAKKFDDLLLKYKPVHMVGVPSYWGTIINSKKLATQDLSFIIAPTVGGDTMDVGLECDANRFLEKHGCRYPITKGYGMTEVCAGVTGTLNENNEIGSVGVPFCKTVVSIFDSETEVELKYNEYGEICISGPNVMMGYYDNEYATDAIKRKHKDGTVWIHSGDIGYMNENGSLFLVDRMKRMIVRYDGFKVFPSFVEKVVLEHKEVMSCCVVGIRDKEHSQGKLPIVFVVLNADFRGDKDAIEEELRTLCKAHLPEYAQPVAFRFVENMPVTSIGKIDYREMERMACDDVGAK